MLFNHILEELTAHKTRSILHLSHELILILPVLVIKTSIESCCHFGMGSELWGDGMPHTGTRMCAPFGVMDRNFPNRDSFTASLLSLWMHWKDRTNHTCQYYLIYWTILQVHSPIGERGNRLSFLRCLFSLPNYFIIRLQIRCSIKRACISRKYLNIIKLHHR